MAEPGSELRADCQRCFGLCCVALNFARSADFAIDKPAGQPCPNLRADFRCVIHDQLRPRGFAGCAAFDCFGAGQKVAQVTYGGRDWRRAPETAEQMFRVFSVMQRLHELLWQLTEALKLDGAHELRPELTAARDELERVSLGGPEELLAVDVTSRRRHAGALLARASRRARAGVRAKDLDLAGADLVGKRLRGKDFHGANLAGALLLGADLRRADLRMADVNAADLRAADLRGADLSSSLFLSQAQLDSARGDHDTLLPPALRAPAQWSS